MSVGKYWYPDDRDLANLDGKTLSFGFDASLWPHPAFLAFHNTKFEYTQKKVEAAAEPKKLCRQDTEDTLHSFRGPVDPLKAKWLEEQQNIKQYEPIEEELGIDV